MTRILNAARLQLVGWQTRLIWPWFVLAISFVANFAFYGSLGGAIEGPQITGGLLSIFVVELIFCGQTMTQVLPLALGLSMTRKSFFTATVLSIVVRSVVFGIGLGLLKLAEDATNGWGVSLQFFGVSYLAQSNAVVQMLCYAVLFIVLDLQGVLGGVIFKRWGINGVLTLCVCAVLALAGVVALLTWRGQWQAVFDWISAQPTIALMAGWPMLFAVVVAAGGFLAIRRVTPT